MPDPTLQTALSRFDYQPLSPDQQSRIDVVRASFKAAAAVVIQNCGPSLGRDMALDRLRSVMSDAVHGIAHEGDRGLIGRPLTQAREFVGSPQHFAPGGGSYDPGHPQTIFASGSNGRPQ